MAHEFALCLRQLHKVYSANLKSTGLGYELINVKTDKNILIPLSSPANNYSLL